MAAPNSASTGLEVTLTALARSMRGRNPWWRTAHFGLSGLYPDGAADDDYPCFASTV
jgi:hypothetical protein